MAAIANINAGIPTSPLTDADGWIRPEWRAFFNALYLRTGGAIGQSTDTSALEAALAAETAARRAGDQGLSTGISNEANTRLTADNTEKTARQNADALLVPRAQLCSLWAACDLSFLPAADPGHGHPWLNSGVMTVGAAVGVTNYIGLEDGSGHFAMEDGSGGWIFA